MRQTAQKNVIYETVISSCDHPDVETVYNRAKKILPTLSIATVYRVLTNLANQGKIYKVACPTGDRYDKTLIKHAHFKCNVCKSVTDIMSVDVINALSLAYNESENQIDEANFLFSGTCKNCLSNNKTNNSGEPL